MAALSVRSIEAIKPRDRPFKGSIDRGLQLRVAPDGRRTLLFRYTVKGSRDERQYSLPHDYGEGPGQIRLADAKAEAARIRALARNGIDWPEQEAERLRAALQEKLAAEPPPRTPSPRPCANTPSASVAPRTAWPSRPAPGPTTWA